MEMALANCDRCGRLFNRVTRNICPDCIREEEQMFDEIKAYLREHEGATVTEVSEATGVAEERILHYLRDGRLVLSGTMSYPCESCGKPIRTGRFCTECKNDLEAGMSDAARSLKQQLSNKDASGAYYSQKSTLRPKDK